MTVPVINIQNVPSMMIGDRKPVPGNIYGTQEWELHLGVTDYSPVYTKQGNSSTRKFQFKNGLMIYRHRLEQPFPTERSKQKKVTITTPEGFSQEVAYVVPLSPNGDLRWQIKEANGEWFAEANPTVGTRTGLNGKGRLYFTTVSGTQASQTHWMTWDSVGYDYQDGQAKLENTWNKEVKLDSIASIVWVDQTNIANVARKNFTLTRVPMGTWSSTAQPSKFQTTGNNTVTLVAGPANHTRNGTAHVYYELVNKTDQVIHRSDVMLIPVVKNNAVINQSLENLPETVKTNANKIVFYVTMENMHKATIPVLVEQRHKPVLTVRNSGNIRVGQEVTYEITADKPTTGKGYLTVNWKEEADDYVGTPASRSLRYAFEFNNSMSAYVVANISKLNSEYKKKPEITYVIEATATLEDIHVPGTDTDRIKVPVDKYTGGWALNVVPMRARNANVLTITNDERITARVEVRIHAQSSLANEVFSYRDVLVTNGAGQIAFPLPAKTTYFDVIIKQQGKPDFTKRIYPTSDYIMDEYVTGTLDLTFVHKSKRVVSGGVLNRSTWSPEWEDINAKIDFKVGDWSLPEYNGTARVYDNIRDMSGASLFDRAKAQQTKSYHNMGLHWVIVRLPRSFETAERTPTLTLDVGKFTLDTNYKTTNPLLFGKYPGGYGAHNNLGNTSGAWLAIPLKSSDIKTGKVNFTVTARHRITDGNLFAG